MNAFQKLCQAFKVANPDYHITYAAPPVISAKDRFGSDWFDGVTIAGCVDAIVPMLYTANPPSIGWTTSAEPLAGSKATERTIARDMVTLMDDSYAALGGQKDKLLLGINSFPWPGVEFQCRTADRLAASIGLGKSQPFEYLDRNAHADGKRWDWEQQAAWYVYQDGDQFVQGWYDDDRSWAAMWDMLRAAFGAPVAGPALSHDRIGPCTHRTSAGAAGWPPA